MMLTEICPQKSVHTNLSTQICPQNRCGAENLDAPSEKTDATRTYVRRLERTPLNVKGDVTGVQIRYYQQHVAASNHRESN